MATLRLTRRILVATRCLLVATLRLTQRLLVTALRLLVATLRLTQRLLVTVLRLLVTALRIIGEGHGTLTERALDEPWLALRDDTPRRHDEDTRTGRGVLRRRRVPACGARQPSSGAQRRAIAPLSQKSP